MKPAPFTYHRPMTLQEALAALADLGEDAKILAGGQSLIPLMNMRLARPEHLVDIAHIPELTEIRIAGDELRLGAMVRHREIEKSPEIRTAVPLLSEAAALIAHSQIRERGTIGGSLAHSDPAGEFPLVALLLGATMYATGLEGSRRIDAQNFFVSFFTTDLRETEILTKVSFPRLAASAGCAIDEVSRRHGDFAIVSAAAYVSRDAQRYQECRVVLGGVAPTPVLFSCDELLDEVPSAAALESVAKRIAGEIQPRKDIHGSEADRRDIARTMVRRTLARATERSDASMQQQGGGRGSHGK